MFTAIKEWDNTTTNITERTLMLLHKLEFIKFMSFDYESRKAVMENTLKSVLQKFLPDVGAGADTVSALLKYMVPSYKSYKLHNNVEGKWIIGCPLGIRN
eukprot:15037192-Ditylum_brightwellii.AAC.1